MSESGYVIKNHKKLKNGYTTGTCAAAATKAAAQILLSGEKTEQVTIITPNGTELNLAIEHIEKTAGQVSCAVRKNSGDDPDITNGIYIYARVALTEGTGVTLRAGEGVGVVTKLGLEQRPGEPAINKVPRRMIREAAEDVCAAYDYKAGMLVEIFVPEGREIARRTFNPKLGIEGGISILGTSGIVEPMSEKAVLDTIILQMRMQRAAGRCYLLAAPGNYGLDYIRDTWGIEKEQAIKSSNFIGEVIDAAVDMGFEGILFAAHIGKFIKVSGGIMNTHSRYADARMELLVAHAVKAGADTLTLKRILEASTTEEGLAILREQDLLPAAVREMLGKIHQHLNDRSGERLKAGAVVFSSRFGKLGETVYAEALLSHISRNL